MLIPGIGEGSALLASILARHTLGPNHECLWGPLEGRSASLFSRPNLAPWRVGGWDGMGVCPTPARHVARPTLCVSGLCHRLPRAGLGATQTTTDPVRDRRVKFPYPRYLGTLVGITSGASGPQGGGGEGGCRGLQLGAHRLRRPHSRSGSSFRTAPAASWAPRNCPQRPFSAPLHLQTSRALVLANN